MDFRWKVGLVAAGVLVAGSVGLVVGNTPSSTNAPPTAPPAASNADPSLPHTARLTATPFDEGLPQTGQWRNGFDLVDLDHDGHLDIVHGPARKVFPLVPVVFLGDGHGHWRRWAEATFPTLPFDYGDVQARDLDGDGIVDLAFAVHLTGLVALHHDGHGHFTPLGNGLSLDAARGFGSRTLLATEWNAERMAVIALGDGPRPPSSREHATDSPLGVRVFTVPKAGPAEWRLEALSTTALERSFGDALALGDFDADGERDLLVGTGTLGETQLLFRRVGNAFLPVPVAGIRSRALTRAVAFADLDGDRRDDLVVAYSASEGSTWATGIDAFYSKQGNFVRYELAREVSRNAYSAVTSCQLEPGRRSLVAAREDGSVSFFAADGQGTFTRDLELPSAERAGCRGYRLRCADLDGDGRDELVASFAGESDNTSAPAACTSQGMLRAWKLSVR